MPQRWADGPRVPQVSMTAALFTENPPQHILTLRPPRPRHPSTPTLLLPLTLLHSLLNPPTALSRILKGVLPPLSLGLRQEKEHRKKRTKQKDWEYMVVLEGRSVPRAIGRG